MFYLSHTVLCQTGYAATRYRASSNNVAMQAIKVIYPDTVDIGCFSHFLD